MTNLGRCALFNLLGKLGLDGDFQFNQIIKKIKERERGGGQVFLVLLLLLFFEMRQEESVTGTSCKGKLLYTPLLVLLKYKSSKKSV